MKKRLKATSYKSKQEMGPDLPGSVNALRRAGSLKREVEEALRPWDLTWPLYDTLLALREKGPLRVREATREIGEGTPRRLERYRGTGLVGLGYIEKESDPDHDQAKLVVLTEEGEEALSQATLALESLSVTKDPAEVAAAR